jgi:peptidoglycan/LPS O-acetylase OafA/YrhL
MCTSMDSTSINSAGKIATLTALRGIAAWWVVFYHFREYFPPGGFFFKFASGGYLAVDLFFVLSGFVIALNYPFNQLDVHKVKLFLIARLARIYPLHLFVSILFLINPLVLFLTDRQIPQGRYDPTSFFLGIALVSSWGFGGIPLAWNVPSWSISAEWLVYFLFPVIAYFGISSIHRVEIAIGGVFLSYILLVTPYLTRGVGSLGHDIETWSLVRCGFEFAMGAYLLRSLQVTGWLFDGLCSTATLLLGLLAIAVTVTTELPDYIIAPVGFMLIVFALSQPSVVVTRVFGLRALVYLGEISYSTYMIHYFVRDWVKWILVKESGSNVLPIVVYIAFTLLSSMVLYHYIEMPSRAWIRRKFCRKTAELPAFQ